MPLVPGSSKEAISENIKTEMKTHPQKQAVAIAMREAGIPKAKDSAGPAHDPHTGQFTSGSGGASKGSGQSHKQFAHGATGAQSKRGTMQGGSSGQHQRLTRIFPSPEEAQSYIDKKVSSGKWEAMKTGKVDGGHQVNLRPARTKDQQPAAITAPSGGSPAYKGRDLDSGAGCDAGISSPVGCDWPGRVL